MLVGWFACERAALCSGDLVLLLHPRLLPIREPWSNGSCLTTTLVSRLVDRRGLTTSTFAQVVRLVPQRCGPKGVAFRPMVPCRPELTSYLVLP